MVTFEDLLAAKVALQLGVLQTEGARSSLQAAMQTGRTLAQELEFQGLVDPQTARTIAAHARKCSFLKAESTYLAGLRRRALVDEKVVERVRQKQHAENLRARLGDLLVQEGAITKEQNDEITAEARKNFIADNNQVAERYAARGFEGIERPSVTVTEVIAAAAGRSTGTELPAMPELTPSNALKLPPRPTAPPPQLQRQTAPDMAGDLGALGHSAEHPLPANFPQPNLGPMVATAPPPIATTAPAGPSPLTGTGLEGRYQVTRKVGEGGMGAVYLVKELETGREAALKLVRDAEKSKEAALRFKREIMATSMCAHENIIEIFDAGETQDGSYFMVMEYVPGEELADIVKREGAIPLPRALDLYEQILEGMAAVHQARIVHRDLKPQNFRVFKDPETGKERVKIMDFGIARILDGEQFADKFYKTMGGKITGSPAYIAPESITEPDVDGRADLYSLGIALFRMVTGKLPFACKDAMEYLPKHLYAKPPVPSEFNPNLGIPPELDQLILKLLEKAPDARYQRAEDVVAEIRARVRPAVLKRFGAPASVEASAEVTSQMPAPEKLAPPIKPAAPASPMTPPAKPEDEDELMAATLPPPEAGGPVAPTINVAPPEGAVIPKRTSIASKPAEEPAEAPRGCLGWLFGKKKK